MESQNKNTCYYCKEEKEIGKDVFWCPRLRHYVSGKSYYGHWVCLDCCKLNFFKNIFLRHLRGAYSPSCGDCDFPIGAILWVRRIYDKPQPELRVQKRTFIKRGENFGAELHIDENSFEIRPDSLFSYNQYYNFRWEYKTKTLKLIPREILDGIAELVLKHNKLPTKKVILLEDSITFGPLSWNELRKYYWSEYGIPQHFKKELWMDNSPVVIASFYLNEKGVNFDKNTKERIEYIKNNEL